MAELNTGGGDKHKGGKKRSKKASTRVDLTPMVDLGFLLITFFMLATTLLKPQTMEINMPRNDKIDKKDQTLVKDTRALTIILAKNNKIFYFFGLPYRNPKTGLDPDVKTTDFSKSGIRKVLLNRNADIVAKIKELKNAKLKNRWSEEEYKKRAMPIKAAESAPQVSITATDGANYNNLVSILDEMQISSISTYAIIDLATTHRTLIKPLDK